jgi:hypothetical protein
MKLIVHLVEYEGAPDHSAVSIDINLPDGTRYDTLQRHFDQVLTLVYGYPIGKAKENYHNPFDPEDE